MRHTAPACRRERRKHLPEAAELRSFPLLSLSKFPEQGSETPPPPLEECIYSSETSRRAATPALAL